jgi:hypothetical protein
MYVNHIDDEIKIYQERLKDMELTRKALIAAIKSFIYYNDSMSKDPSNKLRAALSYGLEIKPKQLDGEFRFKLMDKIAKVEVKEGEGIGYPTYVGELREMMKEMDIWVDMWKEYVDKDKTEASYKEFIDDIQQHRDEALLALLDQYYGERLVVVTCPELGLEKYIIIVPKSTTIYERFES